MWMRCNYCQRTLLDTRDTIPVPYFCEECRVKHAGFISRFFDRMNQMIEFRNYVLKAIDLRGYVDCRESRPETSEIIIDVTPDEDRDFVPAALPKKETTS